MSFWGNAGAQLTRNQIRCIRSICFNIQYILHVPRGGIGLPVGRSQSEEKSSRKEGGGGNLWPGGGVRGLLTLTQPGGLIAPGGGERGRRGSLRGRRILIPSSAGNIGCE